MKNLFSLLILSSIVISSQAQWELQNSNTTSNLNSVYFLDINSGYAVGDSGIILKTIDGGSNWLEQNSGTIHELNSVHFLDLLTGFCVGNTGTIIKTIDGGMNWIITTLDPSSKLTSVQFTTNSLGYVVGYNPGNGTSWDAIVYRTVDGGSNWVSTGVSNNYPDNAVGTKQANAISNISCNGYRIVINSAHGTGTDPYNVIFLIL